MPYEKLDISTPKPVLSWANHALGGQETQRAKNIAGLPFVFKPGRVKKALISQLFRPS